MYSLNRQQLAKQSPQSTEAISPYQQSSHLLVIVQLCSIRLYFDHLLQSFMQYSHRLFNETISPDFNLRVERLLNRLSNKNESDMKREQKQPKK